MPQLSCIFSLILFDLFLLLSAIKAPFAQFACNTEKLFYLTTLSLMHCILPATDPVSSTGMSLNQDLASVKLKWNESLNILKISLNIWNESLNILKNKFKYMEWKFEYIEFKFEYIELNLNILKISLNIWNESLNIVWIYELNLNILK